MLSRARAFASRRHMSRHEISNNVVCATGKGSDQPAHTRRLIRAFASRFNILLTEQQLEFISLNGGCTGSSESIHVKMSHCWKSHVVAHIDTQQRKTQTKLLTASDTRYASMGVLMKLMAYAIITETLHAGPNILGFQCLPNYPV